VPIWAGTAEVAHPKGGEIVLKKEKQILRLLRATSPKTMVTCSFRFSSNGPSAR